MAFFIWSTVSVAFVVFGIVALLSKKPVGFWTFGNQFTVSDVKKYNRAVAKLWFAFAVIFLVIGIPLLTAEQNSAKAVIPILGGLFASIGLMVVYTRIEKKYRIY